MTIRPLLTLDQASQQLGVKKGSLKSAAEAHGLLIRIGRDVRISPNDIEELIEKCRVNPKAPASIGAKTKTSGSSATQAGQMLQRAQQTAALLKKS